MKWTKTENASGDSSCANGDKPVWKCKVNKVTFKIFWFHIGQPRLWYQLRVYRSVRGRISEFFTDAPVPLLRDAKAQAESMVDPLVVAVSQRRSK